MSMIMIKKKNDHNLANGQFSLNFQFKIKLLLAMKICMKWKVSTGITGKF